MLGLSVRIPVLAQGGENEFGSSVTLFSTLAAINAAGYDAGMDSPLNSRYQVRTQLRQELAKRTVPVLPELRAFYKEHRKGSDTADLAQYISFALVAGGPPNFAVSDTQVPPDVDALKGFSPILARFYQQANLAELWNRAQPAYNAAIAEYQDAVINTLFETNGYLRNPSGYLGRRFQIFLDLLGAPDQVQVRSYKDDYFVVITPTNVPVIEEVRDAYLAYVLDPLSFKYSTAINSKKALSKYSQDAPALDLAYKDDFSLLVTKCLTKAIDARLTRGADKRQALVDQAMREGFILTAAFADLLPAYEKQQEALRIYYPDLVNAIDVKKEEKRLNTVEFVQSAAPKIAAAPAKLQLDPAEASLEAAEGVYEQGQYEEAGKLFKKVLSETADKGLHGRAYYGLARVAVHENRRDEAVDMFQRTAESATDPAILAWAHVYLGRLAQASGNSAKAHEEFKLALDNQGASAMAREAANKGLETTSSFSSSGDKQK
jgi:predicted negative regulator of RcsB-dependent stress response